MSLIEDARRIMHAGPPTYGEWQCAICQIDGRDRLTHNPACPWRSLPRIVRVLEAARDVLDHIDDIEWAQDSLRHDEDTARLREAMNDAP